MTIKQAPPFLRCDWDLPTVSAVQALAKGEATPGQQQHAMRWLVEVAAGTYQPTFMLEGPHESAFAEGRRFVGLQVVKLLSLSTNALSKAARASIHAVQKEPTE